MLRTRRLGEAVGRWVRPETKLGPTWWTVGDLDEVRMLIEGVGRWEAGSQPLRSVKDLLVQTREGRPCGFRAVMGA